MLRCRPWRLPAVVSILLAVAIAGGARAQTVSIVPHVATPVGSPFEIYVHLDTDGLALQGVEIRIGFEPSLVSLQQVVAGDWFTSSGLPFYFHDYTTPGTAEIHFTGALLGDTSDRNGVLGICRFTAVAVGVSPLTFLDWDVRGAANEDVGAAHSTGDLIVIEEAVAARTLTFGQVKALYR